MKLFGNKRKSRHTDDYNREDYTEEKTIQRTPEEIEEIEAAIEAYQRVKLKRILIILVV